MSLESLPADRLPVSTDLRVGGGIMNVAWSFIGHELCAYGRSENLTQFDAPLIERIHTPNRALGENLVLIQRNQLAQDGRGQPIGHDQRVRAVADERSVINQLGVDPVSCNLF